MKKILIIFCSILIIGSSTCFGQSSLKQSGEDAYIAEDYSDAIEIWERLSRKERTPKINLKLAYSYSCMHNPNKAVELYEKVRLKRWPFDSFFMLDYGNVLRQVEQYERAKIVFNEMKIVPQDLIASCDWSMHKEFKDSSVILDEIPLPRVFTINGVTLNGDSLLLPTVVEDKGYQLQWLNLENKETTFFNDRIAWPLNLNSPQIIADSTLLFSGNASEYRFITRKVKKSGEISKRGENKLYVYQMNLNSDGMNIKPLPFNNPEYGCTHPYYNKEEKRIYFSSDMPGGYGGLDIYYIDKGDNGWEAPVNMGSKINTEYDEGFPFERNGLLFFSSKGHLGYGGYDIFLIEMNDSLAEVKNLRKPYNSSLDDIGYVESSLTNGYFVSNREGVDGKDRLWHFIRNDSLFVHNRYKGVRVSSDLIRGEAAELQSKRDDLDILGVVYKDEDPHIANTIIPVSLKDTIYQQPDMYLSFEPAVDDNIEFNYKKDHCLVVLSTEEVLDTVLLSVHPGNDEVFRESNLIHCKKDSLLLPYVYFEFDSNDLIYTGANDLDRLAEFMNNHPQYNIKLDGFTDSRGSMAYNMKLAYRRARIVERYLLSRGIKKERITITAKGVKHVYDKEIRGNMYKKDAISRVVTFTFVEK